MQIQKWDGKKGKIQTDQERVGLPKMAEYGFLRLICMVAKVGQCSIPEEITVMLILVEVFAITLN